MRVTVDVLGFVRERFLARQPNVLNRQAHFLEKFRVSRVVAEIFK
jgi:hypothetical protein